MTMQIDVFTTSTLCDKEPQRLDMNNDEQNDTTSTNTSPRCNKRRQVLAATSAFAVGATGLTIIIIYYTVFVTSWKNTPDSEKATAFVTSWANIPGINSTTESILSDGNKQGLSDDNRPVFRFDATRLNADLFISTDGMTISNRYSSMLSRAKISMNNFIIFHGTIGTKEIHPGSVLYFRVVIEFYIERNITSNDRRLITEVGVSQAIKKGEYLFVSNRNDAWSMLIAGDGTSQELNLKIKMNARELNKHYVGNFTYGTSFHRTYGFCINTQQNAITLEDVDKQEVIYTSESIPFLNSSAISFYVSSDNTLLNTLSLQSWRDMKSVASICDIN